MGNGLSDDHDDDLSDRDIARKLMQQHKTSDRSSRSADEENFPSIRSKDLTSNLMRQQKNRDPLFYYEIIKIMGVGSMGSVAMVRKRDEFIGGSARRKLVKSIRRQTRYEQCFSIPILGACVRYVMEQAKPLDDISRHSSAIDLMPQQPNEIDDDENLMQSASKYALKSIHLNRVTDKVFVRELKNEIEILKSLDHPHIVRPIETFLYRNQLFIVMELCSGGDLYSQDPYVEDEAARIISSILSAVSYMHSKNVVHRDLKYENILFASNSSRSEIKLIDFGLSKKYLSDSGEMTEGVGTIYTMAPEVLKGTYTSQADIWSVGVVAYMLLSSQMPFYGRKRRHIIEQIMECKFDFKGRRWKRVSNQAKEFVKDLLIGDPDERATADEACQSLWLNKRHAATTRAATVDEIELAHQTLKNYANYSHLKKLALMVIAHKSTSNEIGILRKIFQDYDQKKNGVIRRIEFKQALAQYGYSDAELNRLFDAIDLDGSGQIKYTEFLAATIEAHGEIDENRIAEAFDRLDSDDSGFISLENLRELLGDEIPVNRINVIIKEADLTEDNRISYPEFLALWTGEPETKLKPLASMVSFGDLEPLATSAHLSEEISRQKNLMRQDSNAENTTLARANFYDEKKMSERRASNAQMVDLHYVTKVVLNELDEVVEDPEAPCLDDNMTAIDDCEEAFADIVQYSSFDSVDSGDNIKKGQVENPADEIITIIDETEENEKTFAGVG
mmetsp:Transcript_17317/g.25587  ORF Transcript_17317/g.25587 Transcript_17317/m.25587 type:complete len:732 (-) Transcript_17317:106-2301(-)|eukprot:CAMPEP_0194214660 /NCGR_PEP_ID=MMETSP0156-20130528/15989_1 /TAXON_ID=33649 /ORGANISM="Thalassionema nitzschioides, Strain L26-B" /LENGTH=731 /DNA_ID=CAMNT_0038942973 /DNA_START=33 /DNA_END=2228 /DNA_ORIENTATION=+